MTKEEARAELIAGSINHNAQFVTVTRQHLLLALGAIDEPSDGPTDDKPDVPGQAVADGGK